MEEVLEHIPWQQHALRTIAMPPGVSVPPDMCSVHVRRRRAAEFVSRSSHCAEMWAWRRREGIPLNCCTLLARNAAAVSVRSTHRLLAALPLARAVIDCLLGSPHTRTFLPLLSPLSLLCKRGDVVGR